jgi:hypothetical protein
VAFSYIVDFALAGKSNMGKKVDARDLYLELAKAYILADRLGRHDIAKEANEEYRLHWVCGIEDHFVCPRAAALVYENTPESALIRKTMVIHALHLHHSRTCFSVEKMEMWLDSATSHPKFHVDIMVSIRKKSMSAKEKWDCDTNGCTTHPQA